MPRPLRRSAGANAAALGHLESGCWRLLSYYGDPFADLDAAIAESPGVLLGVNRHPHLLAGSWVLQKSMAAFS